MTTIIPHAIIPIESDTGKKCLPKFLENNYNITFDGREAIVSKEIEAPEGVSKESVDAITAEVRGTYDHIEELSPYVNISGFNPHVLVRTNARARLEGKIEFLGAKEDGCKIAHDFREHKGYVVEMTNDGPIVHYMEHIERIPILGGYGSLMDPEQLAANTAPGDLRNVKDPEQRKRLAEESGIAEKMAFVSIDDLCLTFSRAPTAKRHGNTQTERNKWSVLNVDVEETKKSYMILFDPEQLTKDPKTYFAIENSDEMEYGRRLIKPEQVTHYGGAKMNLDRGIWVLDAPLVTDVDGRLQVMATTKASDVKGNYIDMITNGLAGAEKAAHGFSDNYVDNTVLPNKNPLSSHKEFMRVLAQKLI